MSRLTGETGPYYVSDSELEKEQDKHRARQKGRGLFADATGGSG